MVASNLQVLFVDNYREQSIAKEWEQNPLWKVLPAAQLNQVYRVDTNLWARARGMYAAEAMAKEIVQVTTAQHKK